MSDQLTDAIGDLSMPHLVCRDLGHNWQLNSYHSRVIEAPRWSNSDNHIAIVERVLRCSMCSATRTEQLDRKTGAMLRRTYKYPTGYVFPKGVAGVGGMKKGPFRQEWIKRAVKEKK